MTFLAKDEKRLEVIGEGLREARETLARLDLSEWEARLVYDRAVDYLGMTADLRARHLPRSDSAKRRLTDVIIDLRRLGVRDLPAEEDVFEEIDERNASVHDGSITRSTRLQAGLTPAEHLRRLEAGAPAGRPPAAGRPFRPQANRSLRYFRRRPSANLPATSIATRASAAIRAAMTRMGAPPEPSESPVVFPVDPEGVGFVEGDAEVDGLAATSDGLAATAEGLGAALVGVAAGALVATGAGVTLGAGVGVGTGCAVGMAAGVTQVIKAKSTFGFPARVPQAELNSRAWPFA